MFQATVTGFACTVQSAYTLYALNQGCGKITRYNPGWALPKAILGSSHVWCWIPLGGFTQHTHPVSYTTPPEVSSHGWRVLSPPALFSRSLTQEPQLRPCSQGTRLRQHPSHTCSVYWMLPEVLVTVCWHCLFSCLAPPPRLESLWGYLTFLCLQFFIGYHLVHLLIRRI